ncbi:MAG: DUF4143 domain-containing protein [Clostridiales bacterium]|jgi:predicted AAA+ superfamily ATPase|nr:DUF4143 domain-containing protein [Clostridiales bacterium]
MKIQKQNVFDADDALLALIEAQTANQSGAFRQRDFVAPLVRFCSNGDYKAQLGIVFGLRSTGKTVGMLQAAEELINSGQKVAYARFNYETTGVGTVNAEIIELAERGYTHFFLDEAPYLNGFLNESAEWADRFVTKYRIKIVISGTDSFELWLAMNRALYHRSFTLSTNRNSFPEYKRVQGGSFDDYKTHGGVFLASSEETLAELAPGGRASKNIAVENFIENAVVDNLIHTLEHCAEYPGSNNYYTDWLAAIDRQVIFKGVISILKATIEPFIKKNFVQNAGKKNIPNLGPIISNWNGLEKEEVKKRIADSIGIYKNSIKIESPIGSIDALISFLIKVGCLYESFTAVSDLAEQQRTLYFAHNALMNYAIEETKRGIFTIPDIDRAAFVKSLEQAAEGAIIENIVYAHLLLSVGKDEKIFRYRDAETREVDAVLINRKDKYVRLIEIKSKSKVDSQRVFEKDARHLFDGIVTKNIGIDSEYAVQRILVFDGKTGAIPRQQDVLLLVSIEDVLTHYKELGRYLDGLDKTASQSPHS